MFFGFASGFIKRRFFPSSLPWPIIGHWWWLFPDFGAVGGGAGCGAGSQRGGGRGGRGAAGGREGRDASEARRGGVAGRGRAAVTAGRGQLGRREVLHLVLQQLILHRVVQLLRLSLQQDGVEGRVAHHVAQRPVQDVPDVLDLVASAHAARDVLLPLAHLLRQLILQCSNLQNSVTVTSKQQTLQTSCITNPFIIMKQGADHNSFA